MGRVMRYGVMALLDGLALWRYGVMTFEEGRMAQHYGVMALWPPKRPVLNPYIACTQINICLTAMRRNTTTASIRVDGGVRWLLSTAYAWHTPSPTKNGAHSPGIPNRMPHTPHVPAVPSANSTARRSGSLCVQRAQTHCRVYRRRRKRGPPTLASQLFTSPQIQIAPRERCLLVTLV
eukprot:3991390-Prymnesium_polylepis.1